MTGRRSFPLAAPTWPAGLERPAPNRGIGLDYHHEWSRRYPVRLLRAMVLDNLTRPAARLVAPTTVRGDEHLRHVAGPVIFAANHASHLDTPLLLTTLPPRFRHHIVVAAAADYFFDRRWKAVLWSFSLAAIPIERARVDRRSADQAAALLDDGWSLVIFPEGGRTPDGWSQEFKGGAAYLARRCSVPVVPVHISGTRAILAKGSKRFSPGETGVRFGKPMWSGDDDARHFSARVEQAVALLADEAESDWWSARRRAASGTTPPLRGPEVAAWRRTWELPESAGGGRREVTGRRDSWPFARLSRPTSLD